MEAIDRDIERFLAVGDGYGYGSGDGDGDGYGSGDGVKEFNGHKVYDIDNVPTLIYSVKGDAAKGAVLGEDLTLKDCWIAKRGNFFAHGDTLHAAVEAVEAKCRETAPLPLRMGGRSLWSGAGGKITHGELVAATGIALGSSNQEERDAALLAWSAAGLPLRMKGGK